MNKLILLIGIALWAVGAQAQLLYKLDSIDQSYLKPNTYKQALLRSEGENEITLDSIIFEVPNDYRIKAVFNSKGDITSYINYVWFNNGWLAPIKYDESFDSKGFLILRITYNWNYSTNLYEVKSKDEYSYSNSKYADIVIGYIWNSTTSQWEGLRKSEYIFNNNDNATLNTDYNWNVTTNNWEESTKKEYSYNANYKPTISTSYNWNSTSNQWNVSGKSEDIYDNNNNLISSTTYSWNATTSLWKIVYQQEYDAKGNLTVSNLGHQKMEYGYDDKGNRISSTNFIPDGDQWLPYGKSNSYYDLNNKDTLNISYQWDDRTNQFVLFRKTENKYNVDGIYNQNTSYDWYGDSLQWIAFSNSEHLHDEYGNSKSIFSRYRPSRFDKYDSTKTEYIFDTSVHIDKSKMRDLGQFDYVSKIISSSEFTMSHGVWVTKNITKYYFSETPTGIENENVLSVSDKKLIRILTPIGQELQPEQATEGLFIYQYSDGSTRKVMR